MDNPAYVAGDKFVDVTLAEPVQSFGVYHGIQGETKDINLNRLDSKAPIRCTCTERSKTTQPIGVTYKRWTNLFLFCLISTVSAAHWFQYTVIANVVTDYYRVSTVWVDWTAEVVMVMNIIFIYPALLLLEKLGLRSYILSGTYLTILGSYLKQQATAPDTFWLAFLGQTMLALAQVFLFNVPPQLAATWFKENEVSIACGWGVFGSQLGLALGFLLPPFIVDADDPDNYEKNMASMYRLYAFAAIFVGALVIVFFEDKPNLPPSVAEAKKRDGNVACYCTGSEKFYLQGLGERKLTTYMDLFSNRQFVKLMVSYGINGGVFCALSTLTNPLILQHHPGEEKAIGVVGAILMIFGLIGSVIAGVPLSLTQRYKLVNSTFNLLTIVSLGLFTVAVSSASMYPLYATAALVGFFMTGVFTVGFEFGAELTYPESACVSCGFLNAACFAFGIIFTSVYSWMLSQFAADYVLWSSICILIGGFGVSLMIGADLRRQAASQVESLDGLKKG